MDARTFLARCLGSLAVGAGLTFAGLSQLAGHAGLVRLEDDHIGLLVDHVTGRRQVLTSPGYRLTRPFLQELHLWEKSPREFRMQGNRLEHPGHLPRLVVRGPDGSSFWFERVTLHYGVREAGLEALLEATGTDPQRAPELVNAFARSVLRYEFGRFTAEEIVQAENRRTVTERCERALQELLGRYGLEVLQIAVSKPRFPGAYEETIERRKVADQETESLAQEVARLNAGRQERLDQLRRKKQLEREQTVAGLEQQLELARRANRRARHAAEVQYADRVQEGVRARDEGLARAAWNSEQARVAAAGVGQRARAMQQGRALIRRALARALGRAAVTFLGTGASPTEGER